MDDNTLNDMIHQLDQIYQRNIKFKFKSKSFVNYINENGNLKSIPLEPIFSFGLELERYFFACQFKESAFIVGLTINGIHYKNLLDYSSTMLNEVLTEKEYHFYQVGYFKEDFIMPDDFRKTDSYFVCTI